MASLAEIAQLKLWNENLARNIKYIIQLIE